MHAYKKDGTPCYRVPNVSRGGLRDTTIADCRKLGLVPSVTEITGQLNKPALLRWKINKVLDKCYSSAEYTFLDLENFKKSILRDVYKDAEKAPRLGKEIHNELEMWYKNGADSPPPDRISKTIFTIKDEVGKYDYVAEKSFYHSLGFGGKVDLHSEEIVLDLKTKDTLDTGKMKGYKEHIMQLAAYRHGLKIEKAACYNLFISRQDTNIVKLVKYTEKELCDSWEMFKCLLKFWQISNRMGVL